MFARGTMDVDMDDTTYSLCHAPGISPPNQPLRELATVDYIPFEPMDETIPETKPTKEARRLNAEEKERRRHEALLKKGMPSDPALQEEWHRVRREQGFAQMRPEQREFLARKQEEKQWREEHKTEIRRARRERKKLRVRKEAAAKPDSQGCIFFHETEEWNPGLFVQGLSYVRLHSKFDVDDSHLFGIAQAHPVFCAELEKVEVGSVQCQLGSKITDAGALAVARACPNLESIEFHYGIRISDQACIEILRSCPELDTITITGHDSQHGSITNATLVALLNDSELGQNLDTLVLVHQDVDRGLVEQLSKARMELDIIEGNRQQQIVTWSGGSIIRVHVLSKGCPVFEDYGATDYGDSQMIIDD